MKHFALGFAIGTILVLPAWITLARDRTPVLRLEGSQETNLPAFDGPHIQRWHDDELRVTCYALRTKAGSALSCHPDATLAGRKAEAQ